MKNVRPILEAKETEAWCYFDGIPTSQDLAYFFCEDMLLRKTINSEGLVLNNTSHESLNLCTKCGTEVASHPPGACKWVTAKLSEEFRGYREQYNVNWLETRESLEKSQDVIAMRGIKLQNVNTYK